MTDDLSHQTSVHQLAPVNSTSQDGSFDTTDWPNEADVCRRFGWARWELLRNQAHCSYLEEGLDQNPWGRFDPRTLDLVEQKRQEVQSGVFTNRLPVIVGTQKIPPGQVWLSPAKVLDAFFQVLSGQKSLMRRRITRLIRRRIIRAHRFGFKEPDFRSLWCLEQDVSRFLAPLRQSGKKLKEIPTPVAAFAGFFDEHPKRYTLEMGAARLNELLSFENLPKMHEGTLRKYAVNGPPKNLEADLSEVLPLSGKDYRLIPGTTKHHIWTIPEPTIDRVFKAIKKRAQLPSSTKGLIPVVQFLDDQGIRSRGDRIRTWRFLRRYPEHKPLVRKVARPTTKLASLTRDVVEPDEVRRFLHGRDLCNLAREQYERDMAEGDLAHRVMAAISEAWSTTRNIRSRLEGRRLAAKTVNRVLQVLAKSGRVERNPPLSANAFQRKVVWRTAPGRLANESGNGARADGLANADTADNRPAIEGNPGLAQGVLPHGARVGLSDRQRDILKVLLARQAFDSEHRMTTEEITEAVCGRGRGSAVSFKRPIAKLKRFRLINSKGGRDGGIWLTQSGRRHISQPGQI